MYNGPPCRGLGFRDYVRDSGIGFEKHGFGLRAGCLGVWVKGLGGFEVQAVSLRDLVWIPKLSIRLKLHHTIYLVR